MNQRNNLLPKDFFQEASHFWNRQGHHSPRLRLNAVKLWKEPLPFFSEIRRDSLCPHDG